MIPIRRPAKGSPLLIPEQSEADFQRQVIAYAELNGFRIYHTYDSRRSAAGYPDLTLIHPAHGCIWIELKTLSGKLSPAQEEWQQALRAAGQRTFVFRPCDWQLIETALGGKR